MGKHQDMRNFPAIKKDYEDLLTRAKELERVSIDVGKNADGAIDESLQAADAYQEPVQTVAHGIWDKYFKEEETPRQTVAAADEEEPEIVIVSPVNIIAPVDYDSSESLSDSSESIASMRKSERSDVEAAKQTMSPNTAAVNDLLNAIDGINQEDAAGKRQGDEDQDSSDDSDDSDDDRAATSKQSSQLVTERGPEPDESRPPGPSKAVKYGGDTHIHGGDSTMNREDMAELVRRIEQAENRLHMSERRIGEHDATLMNHSKRLKNMQRVLEKTAAVSERAFESATKFLSAMSGGGGPKNSGRGSRRGAGTVERTSDRSPTYD
jgi:hypothetical protein